VHLLLSGEGVSDMGRCCAAQQECEAADFSAGPLAVMVDQLVEQQQGYDFSHLETGRVGFVHKSALSAGADELKRNRKSFKMPGKKSRKETVYYRNNARVLARLASRKAAELNDDVIALLFRDADGTASAGRGHWQDKWDSMLKGFCDEGFEHGVPMIPMPKSEAWLLCALERCYQHCESLESESGNDHSPNALKGRLSELLRGDVSAVSLANKVRDRRVDINQMDMPSFNAFKQRLAGVVSEIIGGQAG